MGWDGGHTGRVKWLTSLLLAKSQNFHFAPGPVNHVAGLYSALGMWGEILSKGKDELHSSHHQQGSTNLLPLLQVLDATYSKQKDTAMRATNHYQGALQTRWQSSPTN